MCRRRFASKTYSSIQSLHELIEETTKREERDDRIGETSSSGVSKPWLASIFLKSPQKLVSRPFLKLLQSLLTTSALHEAHG